MEREPNCESHAEKIKPEMLAFDPMNNKGSHRPVLRGGGELKNCQKLGTGKYKMLADALRGALAHENHKDGECGCAWTLEARAALEVAGAEL